MRIISASTPYAWRYRALVGTDEQAIDLAAMFASVTRRLTDAEEPVLAAHHISMWEYIVLSRLTSGPVPNQLTLARDVRHDKTRLIPLLDELQQRGLIDRSPDPADRRSHTVSITPAGRRLQRAAQQSIRAMERHALAVLTPAERRALLSALPKLYAAT